MCVCMCVCAYIYSCIHDVHLSVCLYVLCHCVFSHQCTSVCVHVYTCIRVSTKTYTGFNYICPKSQIQAGSDSDDPKPAAPPQPGTPLRSTASPPGRASIYARMDIGVRRSCGAVAGAERTVETVGIDDSPGSRLLKAYTRGAKGLLQEEKTDELMTATQVLVAEQIELQHRRRQALSCLCVCMRARSFLDFLSPCASRRVYAAGVYLCLCSWPCLCLHLHSCSCPCLSV